MNSGTELTEISIFGDGLKPTPGTNTPPVGAIAGLNDGGPFEMKLNFLSKPAGIEYLAGPSGSRDRYRIVEGEWWLFWRWPLWDRQTMFTAVRRTITVHNTDIEPGEVDTLVSMELVDIEDWHSETPPVLMRMVNRLIGGPCRAIRRLWRAKVMR